MSSFTNRPLRLGPCYRPNLSHVRERARQDGPVTSPAGSSPTSAAPTSAAPASTTSTSAAPICLTPRFTTPLIGPAALAALLDGPDRPVVLDVRWRLGGPPGRADHEAGHPPGAVFVDLDTEL